MGPERWQQVERIYHAVAARPSEERAPLLDRECAGDADLRAEVERMLAVESRGIGFLEAPAMEVAARALAGATPVRPGSLFGPDEIVALLGAGGMGDVYKARDTRLNRTVAIKVLPALGADDAERRRRFLQEARAASALKHPNIITLYDILSEGGRDALVMEYVEGRTLDEKIAGEGLPLREALHYAIQIAGALATAQAAGIVHRDVKPGNIMVTGEEPGPGTVTVLDFGLAKFTGGESETERTQMVTTDRRIVGTVAYMSPGQAGAEHGGHQGIAGGNSGRDPASARGTTRRLAPLEEVGHGGRVGGGVGGSRLAGPRTEQEQRNGAHRETNHQLSRLSRRPYLFARWQPSGVLLERRKAGQLRHLREARGFSRAAAPDYQSGRGHPARLVPRWTADRVSADFGPDVRRNAI